MVKTETDFYIRRNHLEIFIFYVDPKVIAFIRKRNKKEGEEIIRINGTATVQNMDIDKQTIPTTLPIELDSRWVHMDNIEREKLEWMKDLPKPSAQRTVDDSVRNIRPFLYLSVEEDKFVSIILLLREKSFFQTCNV